MNRRRQQGAAGVLIIAVLVLMMAGYLAAEVLGRISTGRGEVGDTTRRLAYVAELLEQYAASARRLPCPADPTLATGAEVPASATTCSFPEGTVPWSTLGLRSDDSFDAWGRKISYRVYDGAGSLTQANGISMVECALNGGSGTTGSGLCRPADPDPAQRTTQAAFLAGKGLGLTDFGSAYSDVAYVLVSHGPTGAGGYTVSGARLGLPVGDERDNTKATGPFRNKAFSDPDVEASSASHFDDLMAYRRLPDLVRRLNLGARNW